VGHGDRKRGKGMKLVRDNGILFIRRLTHGLDGPIKRLHPIIRISHFLLFFSYSLASERERERGGGRER